MCGLAILRGAPELRAVAVARYRALVRCLEALRRVAKRPADTPLPLLGITVGEWRGGDGAQRLIFGPGGGRL